MQDKIPIDTETISMAEQMQINPSICALNGGEDYELLFTLAVNDYEQIKPLLKKADISLIGHITEASEGLHLVARDGSEVELKAQGWNSFDKTN